MIYIVARDHGPAEDLRRVTASLPQGAPARTFFGEDDAKSEKVILTKHDVVVSAMSSSPALAKHEVAFSRRAVESEATLILYTDMEATVSRPWFEALRKHAALLFVVNDQAAAASVSLYPGIRIVAYGKPKWEEYFRPKLTRTEVRRALGIPLETSLILVAGGKDWNINRQHFGDTREAMHLLPNTWWLAVSLHPGDQNPIERYQELLNQNRVTIFTKEMLQGEDAAAGADVGVFSYSGMGEVFACQRKPAINYVTPDAHDRYMKATSGAIWPGERDGYEHQILLTPESYDRGPVLLHEAIEKLAAGAISIRAAQEQAFPRPTTGAAFSIAGEIALLAAEAAAR